MAMIQVTSITLMGLLATGVLSSAVLSEVEMTAEGHHHLKTVAAHYNDDSRKPVMRREIKSSFAEFEGDQSNNPGSIEGPGVFEECNKTGSLDDENKCFGHGCTDRGSCMVCSCYRIKTRKIEDACCRPVPIPGKGDNNECYLLCNGDDWSKGTLSNVKVEEGVAKAGVAHDTGSSSASDDVAATGDVAGDDVAGAATTTTAGAKCSTYFTKAKCGDLAPKADPEASCPVDPCVDADKAGCCVDEGHCASMFTDAVCVAKGMKKLKSGSDSITCNGFACVDDDKHACCEPLAAVATGGANVTTAADNSTLF